MKKENHKLKHEDIQVDTILQVSKGNRRHLVAEQKTLTERSHHSRQLKLPSQPSRSSHMHGSNRSTASSSVRTYAPSTISTSTLSDSSHMSSEFSFPVADSRHRRRHRHYGPIDEDPYENDAY